MPCCPSPWIQPLGRLQHADSTNDVGGLMKVFRALLMESALWTLVFVGVSHTQVLVTGENGGKGSHAVMFSANAIQPAGFGTLTNIWAQYCHGVSDRVDAFVSYGNITVFGRSQSYTAIGTSVGLLRRSRIGVDIALYNNASFPINYRGQASPVLLASALVASRPIKIGGHTVTPYGGVSRITPIGRARDSIFTPPLRVYNGVAGVSLPLGKVTLFLEYNPGSIQRSGGMGVLYVFPQLTPSS